MNFVKKIPDPLLGTLAALNALFLVFALYKIPEHGSAIMNTVTAMAVFQFLVLVVFGICASAPALKTKLGRPSAILALTAASAGIVGMAIADSNAFPVFAAVLCPGLIASGLYLLKHKSGASKSVTTGLVLLAIAVNTGVPMAYKAAATEFIKRDQRKVAAAENTNTAVYKARAAISEAFASFKNGKRDAFVDFAKVPGLRINKVARTRYSFTHNVDASRFDCQFLGQDFEAMTDYSKLYDEIYSKSAVVNLFGGDDAFYADPLVRSNKHGKQISSTFLSALIDQRSGLKDHWNNLADLCRQEAQGEYVVVPATNQELDFGKVIPMGDKADYDAAVLKVLESVHEEPLELAYPKQ